MRRDQALYVARDSCEKPVSTFSHPALVKIRRFRLLSHTSLASSILLGGLALALFPRDERAEDANVSAEGSGFSGITLSHSVRSEAEVDAVLAEAVAAGARLLKPAGRVFWGGYMGYFADPDGHNWEVCFNPQVPVLADGTVRLPG